MNPEDFGKTIYKGFVGIQDTRLWKGIQKKQA
jgi:hypothetical protein